MIGAVLHLCGRAVDRLTGADAARLRVTLAALSARVAAAEGEAARLRAELAGLRQTDHDVRTWCEQAADAVDACFEADGLAAHDAMRQAEDALFATVTEEADGG